MKVKSLKFIVVHTYKVGKDNKEVVNVLLLISSEEKIGYWLIVQVIMLPTDFS